jgi:hypothetical protein
VVKLTTVIVEVLGSNVQGTCFMTITTSGIVGQGDILAQLDTWVQADIRAEFEFTFEIEFELELEFELGQYSE